VGPDRAPPPDPESFRAPAGAPFARDPRRSVFSMWCVAAVPGACSRMSQNAVEERLPLLPPLAHRDGTWEGLHEALRRRARVRLRRNPQPSAGIVDSQSLRTTGGVGGEERGFDAGKKVKGTLSAICLWPPRGWCSQGEDPRGERLRPRWHKTAYSSLRQKRRNRI
jgi:hypothetical protein